MARPATRYLWLFLLAMLAGCAGLRPGESGEPLPPVSANPAVVALYEQAGTDTAEGRLRTAVATIERALRIESRNPRLWQELARLRLAMGDPDQAEQLAARALSWSGDDRQLRAANWQLIAESRAARGDSAGAREAQARVRQYRE